VDLALNLNVLAVLAVFAFVGAILLGAFCLRASAARIAAHSNKFSCTGELRLSGVCIVRGSVRLRAPSTPHRNIAGQPPRYSAAVRAAMSGS
jgi:hypothetical protein